MKQWRITRTYIIESPTRPRSNEYHLPWKDLVDEDIAECESRSQARALTSIRSDCCNTNGIECEVELNKKKCPHHNKERS